MRKLKPTKPIHYPGYIAPNGDYYACPDGAHIDLAEWITEELNLSLPNRPSAREQEVLDELGWLHITRDGTVYIHRLETITQAQMNTLGDFLTCEHHDEPPPEIMAWKVGDKYLNGTPDKWVRHIKSAIDYYSRDRVR